MVYGIGFYTIIRQDRDRGCTGNIGLCWHIYCPSDSRSMSYPHGTYCTSTSSTTIWSPWSTLCLRWGSLRDSEDKLRSLSVTQQSLISITWENPIVPSLDLGMYRPDLKQGRPLNTFAVNSYRRLLLVPATSWLRRSWKSCDVQAGTRLTNCVILLRF